MPDVETTPDPKIAELTTQVETLTATLGATRRRVEAADAFAKAAGSEWDGEKERYGGGLNFKKAREALIAVEEFSKIDPEKEADRLVAERLKIHQDKFTETLSEEKRIRDEKIEDLGKRLGKKNKNDRIRSALLAQKVRPEKVELLEALADRRVRLDDDLEPVVLTPEGQVDQYVNTETAKLQNRSIEELAAEYRKLHPDLFLGTDSSGSGAKTSDAGDVSKPLSEMTTDDKSAFIEKHGQKKWEQLLLSSAA